ncbi:mCG140291, isoform CRA_a, partial [Mus musculus]
ASQAPGRSPALSWFQALARGLTASCSSRRMDAPETCSRQSHKTHSICRDVVGIPTIILTCSCYLCLELFNPALALRLIIYEARLESDFSCSKGDSLQPSETDRNLRLLSFP